MYSAQRNATQRNPSCFKIKQVEQNAPMECSKKTHRPANDKFEKSMKAD